MKTGCRRVEKGVYLVQIGVQGVVFVQPIYGNFGHTEKGTIACRKFHTYLSCFDLF